MKDLLHFTTKIKEGVYSIESKIEEIQGENERLKRENIILRQILNILGYKNMEEFYSNVSGEELTRVLQIGSKDIIEEILKKNKNLKKMEFIDIINQGKEEWFNLLWNNNEGFKKFILSMTDDELHRIYHIFRNSGVVIAYTFLASKDGNFTKNLMVQVANLSDENIKKFVHIVVEENVDLPKMKFVNSSSLQLLENRIKGPKSGFVKKILKILYDIMPDEEYIDLNNLEKLFYQIIKSNKFLGTFDVSVSHSVRGDHYYEEYVYNFEIKDGNRYNLWNT